MGIIAIVLFVIFIIADAARNNYMDTMEKKDARANGDKTYIDHNYHVRSLADGKRHEYLHEIKSGKTILWDPDTGEVFNSDVYCTDLNKRNEKNRQEAMSKGLSVYVDATSKPAGAYDILSEAKGVRYKDVATGEQYVMRDMPGMCRYYLRVTDGMFVRLTDNSKMPTDKEALFDLMEKVNKHNESVLNNSFRDEYDRYDNGHLASFDR